MSSAVRQPAAWFFDMDNTLIANDCDVSWISFLVRHKLAPADSLQRADFFYDQYKAGRLDLDEFFRFQLGAFIGRTPAEMAPLADRHFAEMVRHTIYDKARTLVAGALASGRPVALLTATNEVLAAPFSRELRIPHLLATRLELAEGRYTGRISGAYCGGEGKIGFAETFCREHDVPLADAAYYGDSITDVPLLERVGFPHAVNPAPALRAAAAGHGWPVLEFADNG